MEIRPPSLDSDQRSHQRVLLHEQPRTGRAPKTENAGTGIEGEVDAAVERRQDQVGAASIDRAVDIIIDADSIRSALWAQILNDRLGRRLHLHIKVAEYAPAVCTHFRVGFDALR